MTEEEFTRKIRAELTKAVYKKNHNFRTMQIATNGKDNTPQIRSVILRDLSFDESYILIHTDKRSQKVQEIYSNPKSSILMWDSKSKLQLRWAVEARVHLEGEIYEKLWSKQSHQSLRLYLSPGAPGERSDSETEKFHKKRYNELSVAELNTAKKNFCALELRFKSLDVLFLRSSGHLRASYEFHQDRSCSFQWLNP